MASFCSSALTASHFLCGHWRSSLFTFLRWVFFGFCFFLFWLHCQPWQITLSWFDCSVPFTGSSSLHPLLSVVWSLQVLFGKCWFIDGVWNLMCWPPHAEQKTLQWRYFTHTIIYRSNHINAVVSRQGGTTASAVRLLSFSRLAPMVIKAST